MTMILKRRWWWCGGGGLRSEGVQWINEKTPFKKLPYILRYIEIAHRTRVNDRKSELKKCIKSL